MIQYASGGKESFNGKRVAISGSGNVAQYAALKAIELGATVISLSDSKGALIATDEKGITPDEISLIAKLKVERKQLTEIATTSQFKDKYKYVEGARPWTHVEKVDVALPSATQNEVSGEEAEALIKSGAKFIAEGSNMGCSQEAIDVFEANRKSKKGDAIWYAPGKSNLHLSTVNLHCALSTFYAQSSRRDSLTDIPLQAKPPTPVVSPCPVSKWRRIRNASHGRLRKWTTSSRASWRSVSRTACRPPRSMSSRPRASSPVWLPAAISRGSRRWRLPCSTRVIGGRLFDFCGGVYIPMIF